MIPQEISDRVRLADRLRELKHDVAVAVTEEFFRRHPDWRQRYGAKFSPERKALCDRFVEALNGQ